MQTQQMNDTQWKIAHALASELHNSGTDVNEFGKVVAFIRRYQENTIEEFWLLLQQMADSGDAFSHSNKTPEYFINIKEYCGKHLKNISSVDELLLILGWCRRLMYYYKVEPKRAAEEQRPQQPNQQETEQQPKIISLPLSEEKVQPKYFQGNSLKAKVLKKQGIKVTVQLQTDEKQEIAFEVGWYPKNVGDEVNVKVTSVDDNGNIRKVAPN